jgi:hypothetical protein
MVLKSLLIFLVIAILLEDGSSIRKTEEERKEDEKIAELVNATLAEEEKRRKEEEDEKKKVRTPDEKKKTTDKVMDQDEKKKMGVHYGPGTVKKEDEASSSNHTGSTCPVCEQCPDSKECRPCSPCELCPEVQPCPEERTCPEEQPCQHCRPCVPCPVDNSTQINSECPSPPSCTESSGISVPVAMVIGASISLVTMGAAAVVGLILRYVPPLISGILFLSVVFVVWFLSSHHPEVAREAGERILTVLQETTSALGHRIMEAIRHHHDQVGLPTSLSLPI